MRRLKQLFLLLILGCLTTIQLNAQSNSVLDATAGQARDGSDGLKLVVSNNGSMQIFKYGYGQWCCGNTWNSNPDAYLGSTGLALKFRFMQEGNSTGSGDATMTTCGKTSVTGSGTSTDPYKLQVSGTVNSPISGKKFYITIVITKISSTDYYYIDYYVRAPLDLAAREKVFISLDEDDYIGAPASPYPTGCPSPMPSVNNNPDRGFVFGHNVGGNNYDMIGTANAWGSHYLKVNGMFDSYTDTVYHQRWNTIPGTVYYTNAWYAANTEVDIGQMVQFSTDYLSAGQSGVRRLLHGYGAACTKTTYDGFTVTDPVAPGVPTQVNVSFASSTVSELEGNATHVAGGIKLRVSGGVLTTEQLISMVRTGGSASLGTDYDYQQLVVIPAGDYTTARELDVNNFTIYGNTTPQNDRTITFQLQAGCNDLAVVSTPYTCTYTILDDDATVNAVTDQTVCAGSSVPVTTITGSSNSPVFSWTNDNTSIGLAASGTGNLPAFTAVNSGATSVVAHITVTPSKNGVNGTPTTFSITVNPNVSLSLTSAAATTAQTVCQNTNAITNITYSYGNGATGATVTGLPTGITASVNSGVVTISGTPSVSGVFNYTVTTTGAVSPCTDRSLSGTITVNELPTLALTSTAATTTQTVCQNTSAITNITYSYGGGATSATVSGLPTGVTASTTGGVVTISGTPSVSGTFNYTVTTTGAVSPCTNKSLSGTITVNALPALALTSAAGTTSQTVCQSSSAITNITYSYGGGATGATVSGLPTGVTASTTGGVVTISGTPSASGTFNYTVTTTGAISPCTDKSLSGTITVRALPVLALTSTAATTNQTICLGSGAITNITYSYSGGATSATVSGLPTGTTASTTGGVVTISGTPSVSGTFNYTVTTSGAVTPCSDKSLSGTITINPTPVVNQSSSMTICGNEPVSVTFTGNVTGGTYDWTNSNTSIGLAASSTGDLSFTAVNNGATDQTATIQVTPKANGCAGTPKSFTITVKPKPVLSISSPTVTEGGTLNFVLTLSASPCNQPITVVAATANGTAVAPGDYTANTQTITFNPGETSKTFSVITIDDQVIENTETMTVNLTNLSSNCIFNGGGATLSATGTINDNDCDKFTVTVNNTNIYGGPTTPQIATFTIALQSGYTTEVPFTIALSTTGSTAVSGTNYTTTIPASVSFSPADMTSKTFTVTAKNTNVIGSALTTIFKANGTTSLCATTKSVQTTINDESGNAINKAISITVDNPTIYEPELGGTPSVAIVTVKLPDDMTSSTDTRVNLSYTGSTAVLTSDYELSVSNASIYIDIPAGQNSVTFTITALTDLFLEGDELIKIAGTASTGFTMATGSDNITITLKDKTPGDVIIEKVQDGAEPGGVANKGQFRVKFKKDNVTCTQGVKVTYVISGTAQEGIDYSSLTPHEVTIPSGSHEALIDIDVINNYIIDGNRSVILQITGVVKLP